MLSKSHKIVTPSGGIIDVLKPRPDQINIYDIARGLSQIARFKGDTRRFYTVARHSFVCSYLVDPRYALEALLHDAPEAYLGDVISPVKAHLPCYQNLEQVWWEAIAGRYNLPKKLSSAVKKIDGKVFADECVTLLREENREAYFHVTGVEPTFEKLLHIVEVTNNIPPLTNSFEQFIERAKELGIHH